MYELVHECLLFLNCALWVAVMCVILNVLITYLSPVYYLIMCRVCIYSPFEVVTFLDSVVFCCVLGLSALAAFPILYFCQVELNDRLQLL